MPRYGLLQASYADALRYVDGVGTFCLCLITRTRVRGICVGFRLPRLHLHTVLNTANSLYLSQSLGLTPEPKLADDAEPRATSPHDFLYPQGRRISCTRLRRGHGGNADWQSTIISLLPVHQ